MTTITEIHQSGMTRRWHSNPDMMHVVDPVDGHSNRVAKLYMHLWPSEVTTEVLAYIIIHDDGESDTGDMSFTAKRKHPELRQLLEIAEFDRRYDLWGDVTRAVGVIEIQRINFCDRLDAFLMVRQHNPASLTRNGWPEDIEWLVIMSKDLCVEIDWSELR